MLLVVLDHYRLSILPNFVHLLVLLLVHLLLVHEELLLLLWAELLQKFLLLLRVKTLQRLHQLHLLLQLGLLLGSLGRALVQSRVYDVLALSFFLLGRHFVDNLLVVLCLLGRQNSSLMSCKLILFCRFLRRMVSATLQSREEIVQKDSLTGLHLSSLSF